MESEIRKLAPEGKKISQSLLAKATIASNTMLRRKQGISAFELHTARSQDTGSNLHFDDAKIFEEQLQTRKLKKDAPISKDIRIGDTVTPIAPQKKHQVRDIYLVTGKDGEKVSAQRILHPLSDNPIKFMSRNYTVNPKHLFRIHRPEIPDQIRDIKSTYPKTVDIQRKKPWSPINEKHYLKDASDEEEEDDDNDCDFAQEPFVPNIPITPPPSNEFGFQAMMAEQSDESPPMSSPIEMEMTSDQLELYLSDSDQSSRIGANTSTEVLEGDFSEEDVLHEIEEDNYLEEDVLPEVEEDDFHMDANDGVGTGQELFQEEEADEYIQQFSPDVDVEDEGKATAAVGDNNLEEDIETKDTAEGDNLDENAETEDDSQSQFLLQFIYDQNSQPKKKDVIYYFDLKENDFVKVKIISKSNYRYYYNIRFMDLDRPDAGIYFRPQDFWSHSLPVRRSQQEDDGDDGDPGDAVEDLAEEAAGPPPVEYVREGRGQPSYRQISPIMSQFGSSSIRSDRVYRLPVDQSEIRLSPRTRDRARRLRLPPQQEFMRSAIARSLAPPPNSPTLQARVTGFLEKMFLGKK